GHALGRFQLLEHAADRDHVALEHELRLVEPGSHADQLGEVQDRHLVRLAGRGLELLLPGIQREMAERARRDHRVGAGFERLLDQLDELAECQLLTGLDDRETAALDLGRVVDRLAAASLDDRLERPRAVGVLEAHELRGAEDLAAVERRDLEALETLVRNLLELLVTVAVGDQPEEVLDLDPSGVAWRADGLEVLVDALAERLVLLQLEVRLP